MHVRVAAATLVACEQVAASKLPPAFLAQHGSDRCPKTPRAADAGLTSHLWERELASAHTRRGETAWRTGSTQGLTGSKMAMQVRRPRELGRTQGAVFRLWK